MDWSTRRRANRDKAVVKREDDDSDEPSLSRRLAYYPVQLSFDLLTRGFRFLRPAAPYIIPLIVAGLVFPLLVLLSMSAGWYVWKNVAIGWETEIFLQYGDGSIPYGEVSLPPLATEQPYDISLHLVVPAMESNYALGNFMTSLTLSTISNQTIMSIRRPALVPPPSGSFIPFFSKSGIANIDLPLLSAYATGTRNVIAKVELGRRDAWKSIGNGQGRELTVMSAFLRGMIVHRGIRGLVTRFPIISAGIASTIFLIASLTAFAACMLPIIAMSLPQDAQEDDIKKPDIPPYPPTPNPPADDEKPLRRRRSTKRSRSTGRRSQIDTKSEVPETVIPPAEGSRTQVRRRRSRLSDMHSDSDG